MPLYQNDPGRAVRFESNNSYGETRLVDLDYNGRRAVLSYHFLFSSEGFPIDAKAKVLIGFADLHDGSRCLGGKMSEPGRPCWSVRIKAQRINASMVKMWAYVYHLDNPDPDDGQNYELGTYPLNGTHILEMQVLLNRGDRRPGALRIWINGVKRLNERMRFLRSGEPRRWHIWFNGWRNPEPSTWSYSYANVLVTRRRQWV